MIGFTQIDVTERKKKKHTAQQQKHQAANTVMMHKEKVEGREKEEVVFCMVLITPGRRPRRRLDGLELRNLRRRRCFSSSFTSKDTLYTFFGIEKLMAIVSSAINFVGKRKQ